MAQAPLSVRQLRQHVKPRAALKQPEMQITFEPPTYSPKVGVRAFPSPIKGTLVKRPVRSNRSKLADIDESRLGGFLPDHLALNPFKPAMDKRLRRGKFFDPFAQAEEG